jgi:hypothetical protein
MDTRRISALGYVAICLLGVLAPEILPAQEASVRPGINRHFVDPAFEQWVARFERPGREVYDRRHQIVAATGGRSMPSILRQRSSITSCESARRRDSVMSKVWSTRRKVFRSRQILLTLPLSAIPIITSNIPGT